MKNKFQLAIEKKNYGRPPVWFMRQAGRYHSHYQAIRAKHSFIEMCKDPALATEITFGPIEDFGFDAAILFSDLLFPLEVMGMGLRYEPGPVLDWHLKTNLDLERLKSGKHLASELAFQGKALQLIRSRLSSEKGLIGFVGAPLTLFFYAAAGSHQGGNLSPAISGMEDGRYDGFCDKLIPLLIENMVLQAEAGADAIALFDTCGGEVSLEVYKSKVVPILSRVVSGFKERCPKTAIIYYSKKTSHPYWRTLTDLPIDVLGVDWKTPLKEVLLEWAPHFTIQGNVDPEWLHLPAQELEHKLRTLFLEIKALPEQNRAAWICGLGHGVLQHTPEENVRLFLKIQKEIFGE
jgi:uroporphyrinogen decarboxylase